MTLTPETPLQGEGPREEGEEPLFLLTFSEHRHEGADVRWRVAQPMGRIGSQPWDLDCYWDPAS